MFNPEFISSLENWATQERKAVLDGAVRYIDIILEGQQPEASAYPRKGEVYDAQLAFSPQETAPIANPIIEPPIAEAPQVAPAVSDQQNFEQQSRQLVKAALNGQSPDIITSPTNQTTVPVTNIADYRPLQPTLPGNEVLAPIATKPMFPTAQAAELTSVPLAPVVQLDDHRQTSNESPQDTRIPSFTEYLVEQNANAKGKLQNAA